LLRENLLMCDLDLNSRLDCGTTNARVKAVRKSALGARIDVPSLSDELDERLPSPPSWASWRHPRRCNPSSSSGGQVLR